MRQYFFRDLELKCQPDLHSHTLQKFFLTLGPQQSPPSYLHCSVFKSSSQKPSPCQGPQLAPMVIVIEYKKTKDLFTVGFLLPQPCDKKKPTATNVHPNTKGQFSQKANGRNKLGIAIAIYIQFWQGTKLCFVQKLYGSE